jgi:hypothetical protein
MPDNVVHFEQPDPILEPLGRYLQIWTELYTLADVESAILARRDSRHHASGLPDEVELEARRKLLDKERKRVEKSLGETKPTTLEGCAAALDVLALEAVDFHLGSCDWHAAVIENMAEALRSLCVSAQ